MVDGELHVNSEHRHKISKKDVVEIKDDTLLVYNHTTRCFENGSVINMLDF